MSKQFVYIDSSQEQDNSRNLRPVLSNPKQNKSPSPKKSASHRQCLVHNPEPALLLETPYDMLVKELLADKITKETTKQLITKIEDRDLAENINKRNTNYEYFLKKMEIDQKYRAAQEEKVNAIKEQNRMKKQVLYKHQSEKQLQAQELELRKYVVEKKEKQDRVVQHIKGQVRKFGFERIYNAHRKIKEDLKAKQAQKEDELASRLNKQRNQLLELQQQFQQIKQQKRINKLEQRKVLKDLSEKVQGEKQLLQVKITKKPTFEV